MRISVCRTVQATAVAATRPFRYFTMVAALMLALAGAFGWTAAGQGITGSIAGTVTDPSGAPIKGAKVTIRQIGTEIGRAHV